MSWTLTGDTRANDLILMGSSGKFPRGRNPTECLPLDIQQMIEQVLDERHATHKAGECWCVDNDPLPVKRESERRLHFKDRK